MSRSAGCSNDETLANMLLQDEELLLLDDMNDETNDAINNDINDDAMMSMEI